MIPELVPIAQAFAVGDLFLAGLVGDFTAADWQVLDPAGHSPRWLVGHLATYRHRVLAMAGLPALTAAWEDWFTKGTDPAAVPADLDPGILVQAFHDAQAALAGRWAAVTAQDLAKPLGRTLPGGADTLGGGLQFMAWHEAYHLGQLGLLRRLAGKPGRA